jgi:hypothetical protein
MKAIYSLLISLAFFFADFTGSGGPCRNDVLNCEVTDGTPIILKGAPSGLTLTEYYL